MTPARGSLLSNLSFPEDAESFSTLLDSGAARIERIVSSGQATPKSKWLIGERREFVMVVTGRARLSFEGEAEPMSLGSGDWVDIPAGLRRRVDWTDPDQPTVWLAVHFT